LIACGGASSDSPTGSTTSGSATLTWSAVTAPNLQGYRIYHRTAAGTYQPLGQGQPTGTTTYQVTNLSSQTTYYMVVTAYDSLGNESAYSNEVSKTIP
jgi:fibronectin type 3 domain-containing protein